MSDDLDIDVALHHRRMDEIEQANRALTAALRVAVYIYGHGKSEEHREAKKRLLELMAHVVYLGTNPPRDES